jgi:hypothetical protein
MKSLKTILYTIIILMVYQRAAFAQVQAQDPTAQVQEFDFKIDKLGDAVYEVSTKMNQAQWESFKGGPLVNDPSISKRDLERAMSTYVIEDFKRDIDDMNRTVKMSFKLKALATYNGNGKWVLNLQIKDPQITKLSDNSYMNTTNIYLNGQLVQQIYKVSFPDGATNIQQSTDSFGKAIFTYTSGGGLSAYLTWNNILGILLLAAAAFIYFKMPKTTWPKGLDTNRQIAN